MKKMTVLIPPNQAAYFQNLVLLDAQSLVYDIGEVVRVRGRERETYVSHSFVFHGNEQRQYLVNIAVQAAIRYQADYEIYEEVHNALNAYIEESEEGEFLGVAKVTSR